MLLPSVRLVTVLVVSLYLLQFQLLCQGVEDTVHDSEGSPEPTASLQIHGDEQQR